MNPIDALMRVLHSFAFFLIGLAVTSLPHVQAPGTATAHSPGAFNGTWVLDPDNSILNPGSEPAKIELEVRDDGRSIALRFHYPTRENRYTVAFDGQVHLHTYDGVEWSHAVRRDGANLEFRVHVKRIADHAEISYLEYWSLSDDARSLTIHTAYPGNRDVIKVFVRRE